MIALLGNCQTEFLSGALAAKGRDARHYWQASPATLLRSPGRVPEQLARLLPPQLAHHLDGRELSHQFLGIPQGEPTPDLIVVSLFHEAVPLFAHPREGWCFHVDPHAWDDSPELEAFMRRECVLMQARPEAWFQRFGAYVERLRALHPGVPLLLVARLGHFPAFGPRPFSYLEIWEAAWDEAMPALRGWAESLGIGVVEMDRLLAGLMARGEKAIEAHCPFLKIEIGGADGRPVATLRRDVEHVADMWPRLAEKVEGYLATGRVDYGADETPPAWWTTPHAPELLDDETRVRLLNTGSNYDAARAVGSFFNEPERDFSALLAAHGKAVPVCHNLLHMLRAYARLHPGPAWAEWGAAHRDLASDFTANGPVYAARYVAAVDALAEGRTDAA